MRKLRVIEFLSVDGVMQAPGAPDEDTEGGFRYGGWQREYSDDELGRAAAEGMSSTGAYLFGRKTYEIMAAYWPGAPSDDPFAGHLNSTPKYVASTTLHEVRWQNSMLLRGHVVEAVATLKEEDGGDLAVLGSGGLVQTLVNNDLVDEYSLMVSPLVLGSGKRLFRTIDTDIRLSLVDCQKTSTGTLLVTYRPVRA